MLRYLEGNRMLKRDRADRLEEGRKGCKVNERRKSLRTCLRLSILSSFLKSLPSQVPGSYPFPSSNPFK